MKYEKIVKGTFVSRTNRFVAIVDIDGARINVHVKNTGRCRELLIPGTTVYLEDFDGRMGQRKMRYSLIGVQKVRQCDSLMINMDSQAPNKVVREALESNAIVLPDFGLITKIKWEHQYGASRVDFYLENESGHKALVEVKGVTLESNNIARFPDAPTERGIKHIHELEHALSDGYYAAILFVIQMKGMTLMTPNDKTHLAFGEALRQASQSGVHVLAYDCIVTPDEINIDKLIPVELYN